MDTNIQDDTDMGETVENHDVIKISDNTLIIKTTTKVLIHKKASNQSLYTMKQMMKKNKQSLNTMMSYMI